MNMSNLRQLQRERKSDPLEVPDDEVRVIDLTVGQLCARVDALRTPARSRPYYLTLNDAAPFIGVSPPKLRDFIEQGAPAVSIGATTKVNVEEFIAWLKERCNLRSAGVM